MPIADYLARHRMGLVCGLSGPGDIAPVLSPLLALINLPRARRDAPKQETF